MTGCGLSPESYVEPRGGRVHVSAGTSNGDARGETVEYSRVTSYCKVRNVSVQLSASRALCEKGAHGASQVGGADCDVFRYSPPSRALGSLTATQPGRVTKPTQGHPGSPWGACQAECWPLRREPQPPAQHGSCAAERCRSRARPGQRLPPCMRSGGTSRHLLVTSPKRARAI